MKHAILASWRHPPGAARQPISTIASTEQRRRHSAGRHRQFPPILHFLARTTTSSQSRWDSPFPVADDRRWQAIFGTSLSLRREKKTRLPEQDAQLQVSQPQREKPVSLFFQGWTKEPSRKPRPALRKRLLVTWSRQCLDEYPSNDLAT